MDGGEKAERTAARRPEQFAIGSRHLIKIGTVHIPHYENAHLFLIVER